MDRLGPFLWTTLLLPSLTGSTSERDDLSGPHIDDEWSQNPTPTEPLSVLKPKVSPLGMPKEKELMQRRQIVISTVCESF